MKINSFISTDRYAYSPSTEKTKNTSNKFGNVKTNNQSGFKTSQVYQLGLEVDKGTVSNITVYINVDAYEKIAYASTFGEPKWKEMGCDDEKRWVVINGKCFECPHSKEEKELRKGLIEILEEYDNKKKARDKYKSESKPVGNIEVLKSNDVVMNLLGRIFKTNSSDSILSKIAYKGEHKYE